MITATQAPENIWRFSISSQAALRPSRAGCKRCERTLLRDLVKPAFRQRTTKTAEILQPKRVGSVAITPFELGGLDTVSREQLVAVRCVAIRLLLGLREWHFFGRTFNPRAAAQGCDRWQPGSPSLKKNPASLEPHLERYLDTQRDAFAALITALIEDGVYVHIPRGVVVETPIYLLYMMFSALRRR